MDELAKRILHRRQLEEQEKKPAVPYTPCVGMSSEEMSRFVIHLMEQLDAIREELRVSNAEQQRLNALVLSLTEQLHESRQSIADRDRIIENLQSSVRVSNKHRFGSSSQKRRSKTEDAPGRDDNKGDFDGTADSLGGSSNVQAEEDASEVLPKESSSRPSRKGCSNKVSKRPKMTSCSK